MNDERANQHWHLLSASVRSSSSSSEDSSGNNVLHVILGGQSEEHSAKAHNHTTRLAQTRVAIVAV